MVIDEISVKIQGSDYMDFYTVPAIIALPFILMIVLSLVIPSKGTRKKRTAKYYSSPMVSVIYTISTIMLLGGGVFALLYLFDKDKFKFSFFIFNITLYSAVGIGLMIQNYMAVRLSRKTALAGGYHEGEISFKRVKEEDNLEVQPMVVEEID